MAQEAVEGALAGVGGGEGGGCLGGHGFLRCIVIEAS